MALMSNVSYSGLNAQNAGRLEEIQRKEAQENTNKLIEKSRKKAGAKDTQNVSSRTSMQKEGVRYEKTISDSVSAGLEFIRGLEKQISGTKFWVGTVSYGQTYGNSADINFVVHPEFLGKLGMDEAARKQFEEDVRFLNDFSRSFRAQQLAGGREMVSQGWFCDEEGNWGGWSISRPIKQSSVLQDMTDYAEKIRKEKWEERRKAGRELKEYFGDRFKGLGMKWLDEEVKAKEASETEATAQMQEGGSEKESASMSQSIGVNAGKLARKIAAAKTRDQLQKVIGEIRSDMREIEAGLEKGWCGEEELNKVKLLMTMAQNRMGQVEDREATPEEENMFALASLM